MTGSLYLDVFAFWLIGLSIGSFLNVVVYRLPIMIENQIKQECASLSGKEISMPAYNLALPHSSCPKCGTNIKWYDNIPLFSWLNLKGKSRCCKESISKRYVLIEFVCGAISASVVAIWGVNAASIGIIAFLFSMIALSAIDLETYLLPDDITLPLIWVGLLFNLHETFVPIKEAILGAVSGYLLLWVVFHIFKFLTGKEGMGYGDFKLLAAIGAWIGVMSIPTVLIISSVSGILIWGISKAWRSTNNQVIAFGPHLAIGGSVGLFINAFGFQFF